MLFIPITNHSLPLEWKILFYLHADQTMLMCNWQFMFHQPLRVITTMLLLTSTLVLYQFYILAQATEWSHILSVSILLFSNYTTLFKLTRDRIVLSRSYGKEESSLLWLSKHIAYSCWLSSCFLNDTWHVCMYVFVQSVLECVQFLTFK